MRAEEDDFFWSIACNEFFKHVLDEFLCLF